MNQKFKCSQISCTRYICDSRMLPKNNVWIPQAKNFVLLFCGPPNFEKKHFFQLKNRMVKVVCGSQKCIPEHFFGCSKYPLYHMSISQRKISALKNTVFWHPLTLKIPKFLSPKFFFEIWIYGIRGTYNIQESALECIFGPHNPL